MFLPPGPASGKSRDSQLLIATRDRELVRVSVDKEQEEQTAAVAEAAQPEVTPMETEAAQGEGPSDASRRWHAARLWLVRMPSLESFFEYCGKMSIEKFSLHWIGTPFVASRNG